MPFVFDIADIYKPRTTLVAAFQTLSINQEASGKQVLTHLKNSIEEHKLLQKIPEDIEELLA